MRWPFWIAAGVLAYVGVTAGRIALTQLPAICYADYRAVERRLAAEPEVTITATWKHEDMRLEDCGFTLQVRACPPIRVDFGDGDDWLAQFD